METSTNIKVQVNNLNESAIRNINNAAEDLKNADLYNASVCINGFSKHGYLVYEAYGKSVKGDLGKCEQVEIWIENRYGLFVQVFTKSQEAFDRFDDIVNIGNRYKCTSFRNNTNLNPRGFEGK